MTKKEFEKIRSEEGDEYYFTYKNFKCEILRHLSVLHLCGYVYIPTDSPYFKEADYDLYHNELEGQEWTYGKLIDNCYKLGFDCAHLGQLAPYVLYEKSFYSKDYYEDDIYWTRQMCEETLKKYIDNITNEK